jgi:hypothetical protein
MTDAVDKVGDEAASALIGFFADGLASPPVGGSDEIVLTIDG